ncbi:MAG: hypothetical protein ACHQU0_03555 [Candidatus Paceibacteria bacterium]
MTQEFTAGIIPVCPVCERGVNNVCDDTSKQVDSVWYHGPCSRFANSERLLTIADRIIETIESATLINPLFMKPSRIAYKRLRGK